MTPIALLVDDPCPIVHVFRDHWVDVHKKPPTTADGRELYKEIPNAFLVRFCDVMERHGIKGKFSIVPAPSGKGDVVRGIEGHDPEETHTWIGTAKSRLGPLCDFCPEMITHNLALNLETGGFFEEGEAHWSQHQDRTALTPYIAHALSLLKEAGVDCTGVTSPWIFGQEVLPEYEASIRAAQKQVSGREFSWYFLHMVWDRPWMQPWVANGGVPAGPVANPAEDSLGELMAIQDVEPSTPKRPELEPVLISIPATVKDHWWRTIDSPRTDDAWISEVADLVITEDGASGDILTVLEAGGWPVLLTHWQSLYSNGLETGLAVLDLVGERINRRLSDRVQWMKCSEIADRTFG